MAAQLDISYEAIHGLYQDFFNDELHLDELTIVLKILAIAFFMINLWTNMFSTLSTRIGNPQMPFNKSKLFNSFAMVLILISYDKILEFLDLLLMGLDATYSHFSPLDFSPPEPEEIEVENNILDALGSVKLFADTAYQLMFDPTYGVLLLFEGLAWIIDTVIYVVFLMERFFFIGLLKVLGALAIVLSVFDKYREIFHKWLKLYISVYLLIFPFFLVLGFTAYIFNQFDENIDVPIAGNQIKITILAIMIWLKLRLFKKSYDIVYKLFT